jgi:hypothetical protein
MRRRFALFALAVLCLPAKADGSSTQFLCTAGTMSRAMLTMSEDGTYAVSGITGDTMTPDTNDPITGKGTYIANGNDLTFKSGPFKTNFDAKGTLMDEQGPNEIFLTNNIGLVLRCTEAS